MSGSERPSSVPGPEWGCPGDHLTGPTSERPPFSTGRLFPELAREDLARFALGAFVIGRLLEEGDTQDLRWLTRVVGEQELRRWLAERGPRQLSRRSRAFWSLLLSRSPTRTSTADRESPLWPF